MSSWNPTLVLATTGSRMVLSGSPAARAGIGAGDRIVAVDGQPVADNAALGPTLAGIQGRAVQVRVAGPSRTRTVGVNRSLLVVGATRGTPLDAIGAGDRIVAVNGTRLDTEYAFRRALGSRRVATLRTADGTTVTGPVGAAVVFVEDGPAAHSGVEPGPAIITAMDGNRVISGEALRSFLADTRPGQTVSVEYYRNGSRAVHDVVLGQHPQGQQGQLGVGVYSGYSGLTLNDFGVGLYPAGDYLALLSGDVTGSAYLNVFLGGRGGFLLGILGIQFLPFISLLDPTMPANFAGFTGGVSNFYTVAGLPAGLVGPVLGAANVLFWIGWINFNLGIFNCIPGYPLDGGHILRTSAEAVVARLPVHDRRRLTTAITTSVGLVMLASLILMLFGPRLLG